MIQQYINIRQAGGGVAVTVSDTTPDSGDTITITATATGFVPTQYQFLLFNGSVTLLAQQVGNTLSWTVNVGAGNYDIYVLATDGSINGFGLESIVVTVSYQPETIAYMTAVGIPADGTLYYPSTIYERTGLQLWQYVDAWILSGKVNGWWNVIDAIWPMIGGTSIAHKWNAKNPLDTNTAYRLVFFGGVTHNATGITGNGFNGHVETFFNLATNGGNYTQNSASMGFYCRSLEAGTITDMGVHNSNQTNGSWMLTGRGSNTDRMNLNTGAPGVNALSNAQGLIQINRTNSTNTTRWINGFNQLTNAESSSSLLPDTIPLMVYKLQGSGNLFYSPRNYSMFFIGGGMTIAQITNFYTDTQTLQTSLGRQV